MTLSVVIPSFRDPCLYKTIDSILENATGEIEIIPVLDGYLPSGAEETERYIQRCYDKGITDEFIPPYTVKFFDYDERIKPIYLAENVGMREAINVGVAASRGEYLMRADEHCMFAKGFDEVILSTIKDNWIVVPRRYFLDIGKWQVMEDKGYVDYEKLLIIDHPRYGKKFAGVAWKSRTKERRDYFIDETMAMQGSCWFMSRSHWDKVIGRLDSEGYGILYQDSTEMIFKTWQAGGKMMLNKNTWYAHKHRSFNRTHSYPEYRARASFTHAIDVWEDYYSKEIAPKWLT